jgi:hypothetical protein
MWEAEMGRITVLGKPKQKAKPYLKNNWDVKVWRCDSSGRAPA